MLDEALTGLCGPGQRAVKHVTKIQIFAELVFLVPNSEYACVNFLAHILISLIPSDFLFQITQAEKAEMAADCDHFQNLTVERLARGVTRSTQKLVTGAGGNKGVRKRLGGQIDLYDNISVFRAFGIFWVNHPIGQQDEQ